MNVNARIRKLREQLELTTREFGKRVGYSGPMISIIENGHKPEEKLILAICSVFGVNESWMRNGTGEMFNQEHHSRQTKEEVITEFIQTILEGLSETNRQIVFNAIEGLQRNEAIKEKEEG